MVEVWVAPEYCIVPSSATTSKKILVIIYTPNEQGAFFGSAPFSRLAKSHGELESRLFYRFTHVWILKKRLGLVLVEGARTGAHALHPPADPPLPLPTPPTPLFFVSAGEREQVHALVLFEARVRLRVEQRSEVIQKKACLLFEGRMRQLVEQISDAIQKIEMHRKKEKMLWSFSGHACDYEGYTDRRP